VPHAEVGTMSPDTWFPVAGALLTCSIGLVGVLAPRRLLTATRLEFLEGYAITEARSTFGLMLLALGGIPLLTGEPAAYLTAGAAWLGAAAGRLASLLADGHTDSHNLLGLVVQAFIGLLLLYPQSG
jgi:hypothetical protein